MAAPLSGALELTGIYWVTHGLSRVLQGEAPPCLPLPRRSTFPLCVCNRMETSHSALMGKSVPHSVFQ